MERDDKTKELMNEHNLREGYTYKSYGKTTLNVGAMGNVLMEAFLVLIYIK